jgi:hypothetical protein
MRLLVLKLLVVCAALVPFAAFAQKTRPATEADFTGYWRVVLIPDEVHKSRFTNQQVGYTAQCQYFVHRLDGAWLNVTLDGQCPVKRSALEAGTALMYSPFKWERVPGEDGLFFIRAPDNAVVWKADYVLEDMPGEVLLLRGDLVMQLTEKTGPGMVAPVWPMVLRPLPR